MYSTLSLSNYRFFKFTDWVMSYCSEHRIVVMDSSSTAGFHRIVQLISWGS